MPRHVRVTSNLKSTTLAALFLSKTLIYMV